MVLLLFSPCVQTLFYLLATVQILLGLYLIGQGWQWLGYVRRRVTTDPGFYAPRTAVLCPCRGLEPRLDRNLVSLCDIDHQNYKVFFILAAASYPTHSIVKLVALHTPTKPH